jgi:uncharacterized protein (DUF4213/DUF364 family)
MSGRADVFSELLVGAVANRAARAEVLDLRVGPFWTVVHTTVGCGVASTMARAARPGRGTPVEAAGNLLQLGTAGLAGLLRSGSVVEAAVGLATVNALLGAPVENAAETNAEAIIGTRGAGRRVAVIGHFPFVDRLRPRCGELWVFERGPNAREGDLGATDMGRLLPTADVVAITGTTLINHTLGGILALVREDALTLMLGPSTPMTPAMFGHGLDMLCGTVVTDPEGALRAAGQGAVTYQIRGVRRLVIAREGVLG